MILFTFFLSVGITLNEDIEFLKYLTPFQYFDAQRLLQTGFEPVYLILTAVIVVVLTALTYFSFRRKDLSI